MGITGGWIATHLRMPGPGLEPGRPEGQEILGGLPKERAFYRADQ
jgi:hypothetical protein